MGWTTVASESTKNQAVVLHRGSIRPKSCETGIPYRVFPLLLFPFLSYPFLFLFQYFSHEACGAPCKKGKNWYHVVLVGGNFQRWRNSGSKMQEARFDLRKFSIESSQLRNAKDSAVPASGLSKTPTHMLDDVDRKPLGATHVAWA